MFRACSTPLILARSIYPLAPSLHSKVDSIQYYAHQVQNFNDKVRAEQTSIKQVYALYGYDLPDDEDPTIDTGSHSQSLTQPIQPDTAGRDESELARMRRK
ncbi:hypothetical protein SARC_14665, partial [Sphaeroforma arctica JP610]